MIEDEHYLPSAYDRGMTFFVVLLSSFVTPFMASSVNIALPSISEEFSLNAVTLNWVATSYLLATAMLLLPMGRLADIHGRARIFAAGMAVFAVSSLAAGLAGSIAVLIASRVVQGIGGALIFSTGIAMLSAAYRPEIRGRMIGYSIATVYVGLTAGPFFGGWITQNLSWRCIFFLVVPLAAAAFMCASAIAKREHAHHRSGGDMDVVGSITYGTGLFLSIYGFSRLPGDGLLLAGLGLSVLAAFVIWERRQESPLFDLRLFTANRMFAFSNIAALINYAATFSTGFLISLYLQYIKSMTPEEAGLVLIFSPVVMAAVSLVSGRLSDRVDARVLSSVGMVLTAAGLFSMIFIAQDTGIVYIIAALVVSGAGFGIFSSPNTNAVMGSVEKRYYGVASGILATMRMLGQALSMASAMLVFSVVLGRVEIAPGHYGAFMKALRICFMLYTLLCMFGAFASLARKKPLRSI